MFSCGVFIDLQKAFDTVDCHILLHKLSHYGIRGVFNKWFCSYLNERTQITQVGSHISKREKTSCGVPQGSVFGPLLFLIYINDIYKPSNTLGFYLFADDTNLLYAAGNLKSLESVVNVELLNVCDWLSANKLSLNIKKTNFVTFHPYQYIIIVTAVSCVNFESCTFVYSFRFSVKSFILVCQYVGKLNTLTQK